MALEAPHPATCRCFGCTVANAIVLLETGRGAMAADLLRPMVDALRSAKVALELATRATTDLMALRAQANDQRAAALALDGELDRRRRELAELEGAITARREELTRPGAEASGGE